MQSGLQPDGKHAVVMDHQTVINWLSAAMGLTVGWVLRVMWISIHDLKRDMRQIERELPVLYTRREDFKADMTDLKEDMKAGFAKLEAHLALLVEKIDRDR